MRRRNHATAAPACCAVAADATRVESALALAGIPEARFGKRRRARLGRAERELHSWILRHFSRAGRPRRDEVALAAQTIGADLDRTLETLAREDLVHLGPDGEIAVAYPFSGRPTAHRVRFRNGSEASAMCAIDALGIAPMLGEPVTVRSRDPGTGEEIAVGVEADGTSSPGTTARPAVRCRRRPPTRSATPPPPATTSSTGR